MQPDDPIFTCLQECERTDQPVKLINAYRGIPITYPVRVLSVGGGMVDLGVNDYQAICLARDKKTYLQYPGKPEVLSARVIFVDIANQEARLTEFTKATGSMGKRLCTRVQPIAPINAEIRLEQHLLACQLVDISLTGAGIVLQETNLKELSHIHKGARLQLHFTLPPLHAPVQLAGQVTSVGDPGGRHLGCQIFPKGNMDRLLLEYVALRRDELMRELSLMYTTLRREGRTPFLQ